MDITIDVGSLYFGLKAVEQVEANLSTFVNSLNGLNVSSELPSAGQLSSVKNALNNAINSDIRELRIKLENSKTIIEENDAEAAMLFGYMEQGYINEDLEFVDMPFMDQTDYGNVRYSAGSVATSGCGLTAVCMVATYLTGELYTPDELAPLVNNAGSNVDKMTKAADIAGLNWYCNENTSRNDLVQMLSEGKIVVCLVKSSSHFVVCKGLTEDGKILVNDPYGPWAKDTGYTMEELNMSAGKTWVFDPADNQPTNNNSNLGDVTISNAVVSQIDNVSGTTLLSGEDLAGVVVTDDVDTSAVVNLRQDVSSDASDSGSNINNNSNTTVSNLNNNTSTNTGNSNSTNRGNSSVTDISSNSESSSNNSSNGGSYRGSSSNNSSNGSSYKGSSSNSSSSGGSYRGSSSSSSSSGSSYKGSSSSVQSTTPVTIPKTSSVTIPVTQPVTNPVTSPVTVPSASMVTTPVTSPVVVPETTPITIPETNPVVVPETTPVTIPVTQPVTMPVTTPITQPTTTVPITSPTTVVDDKSGVGVPLILGALGTAVAGGVAYKVIKDKKREDVKGDIKRDNFDSYDEDELVIPDEVIDNTSFDEEAADDFSFDDEVVDNTSFDSEDYIY